MRKILTIFILIYSHLATVPVVIQAADMAYVYDDLNRLAVLVYPNESFSTQYTYDEVGNILEITSDYNLDADGDGITDGEEILIGTNPLLVDTDDDGFLDGEDNCPAVYNPDQDDANGDGVGDNCVPLRCVVPNAPHSAASNMKCVTCHQDRLPVSGRSAVCSSASCHGMGSPLPHADHSNAVIHDGQIGPYGDWSTECLDCHNPHLQEQLGHVATNFEQLYLLTGSIDTITTLANTTTITYLDLIVYDQAWDDPATWGAKDVAGRGLVFVPNANAPQETFEIVSATADSLTLNARMNDVLIAALTHYSVYPMQFGIIYGQFIKSTISGNTVCFFGNTTFADNDGLGDGAGDTDIDNDGIDDDSTPDGICQVCHAETLYWRADGTKGNHYSESDCSSCHDPVEGFKVVSP